MIFCQLVSLNSFCKKGLIIACREAILSFYLLSANLEMESHSKIATKRNPNLRVLIFQTRYCWVSNIYHVHNTSPTSDISLHYGHANSSKHQSNCACTCIWPQVQTASGAYIQNIGTLIIWKIVFNLVPYCLLNVACRW